MRLPWADPDWDVVFRGDGEQALRDIEGTRYWKGSFTMPLSEAMKLGDK